MPGSRAGSIRGGINGADWSWPGTDLSDSRTPSGSRHWLALAGGDGLAQRPEMLQMGASTAVAAAVLCEAVALGSRSTRATMWQSEPQRPSGGLIRGGGLVTRQESPEVGPPPLFV